MDKLTFYRSGIKREWRWRYQDGGNNRKLAHAGEGYKNLGAAVKNAFRVLGIVSDPPHRYDLDTSVEKVSGENVHVRFMGRKTPSDIR